MLNICHVDIPGVHLSGTLMFNDSPVFCLHSMDKTSFIIESSIYIPIDQPLPVPQPIYYIQTGYVGS